MRSRTLLTQVLWVNTVLVAITAFVAAVKRIIETRDWATEL